MTATMQPPSPRPPEKSSTPAPSDFEVAPRYFASQWRALSATLDPAAVSDPDDPGVGWSEAIRVVKGRFDSRFLSPIHLLRDKPYVGFLIVAIDCLLVESLQGLIAGQRGVRNDSRVLVVQFLTQRDSFKPHFSPALANRFYEDVRCGILHDGETKNGWLVWKGHHVVVDDRGPHQPIVLDRLLFHRLVEIEFKRYLSDLRRPGEVMLRTNLKVVFDQIAEANQADARPD